MNQVPGYHDHLLAGASITSVGIYLATSIVTFSAEAMVATTAFVMLATVFPDIDHPRSVISRLVTAFCSLIGLAAAMYLAYPAPGAMLVSGAATAIGIKLLIDAARPAHRTVTHTLRAAVVFAAVTAVGCRLALGTALPGVFAFPAYCSHLVLDGTWQR